MMQTLMTQKVCQNPRPPQTRKPCGNSVETSRIFEKCVFIASGKGAEILRKVCRSFAEILWKIFCNDPFPNDPIFGRLKTPNSRFALHGLSPPKFTVCAAVLLLIKGLYAFLTPVWTAPSFATFSVHALHFTVYVPSKSSKPDLHTTLL